MCNFAALRALGVSMPKPDGKLTEEEGETFVAWLNEKTKNHVCPVCQNNNWEVGSHIIEGTVYRPGVTVIGGGVAYPQLFVTCNNCQYTRHFMAVPILDFTSEDTKGKEGKESKEASGSGNG